MTPAFERVLARLMRARGIKTKSVAVRVAVEEALLRAQQKATTTDYTQRIGLGNRRPANPRPRFATDKKL